MTDEKLTAYLVICTQGPCLVYANTGTWAVDEARQIYKDGEDFRCYRATSKDIKFFQNATYAIKLKRKGVPIEQYDWIK